MNNLPTTAELDLLTDNAPIQFKEGLYEMTLSMMGHKAYLNP